MSTPHNLAATGAFPSEPREVPLSLADLRIFLAVARTGSFSRAADRVCRTQPAVSQAVRRLEKDVGQRLIARSFPPIQLSPAGQVLQALGHQLFALCDEAKTALDRLSESDVPTVVIGSSETALHAVLPLVGRFRRECSEADVEIRHVTASEVVTQVASGMLDVGVVAEHPSGRRS
jgi:DNA-binding transcriptional LysR family regulator